MNKMILQFKSRIENESFARMSAVSFLLPLNPSVEEITEIKTIVSEAVTNAIIHGYENEPNQMVVLEIAYEVHGCVTILVHDTGKGIEDLELALEPLYTTKNDQERSGMGMTIMQTFSDSFNLYSKKGEGTTVVIQKQLQSIQES